MKVGFSRWVAALVAALVFGLGSVAQAAYPIVTESSGTLTFAPSELVTPVITGAVAAVVSAAALVLLSVGVRWIYRLVKGSR